ncbi:uncharacterized protein [Blastocystis hominis]|uniref:Mitogen-activated protein kinase n=1 Tax=Blastocystis hominis TaxID=12968 RepID=D8M3M9_BLAHO|nr:uncharacterized protein [Blastocystis hominis]CBK22502.2 unnamed protein product [Blastocystis hominis]|eukprot:XP_012896550.1 uncharacterized protein [Blastocystis hominis]
MRDNRDYLRCNGISFLFIDCTMQGSRPRNNSASNPPPEITEKYTIKKELGKGAYGTVYLAVENETKKEVAIKRIDDVFRTKIDAKRALREIVILRHCHHPNICGLKGLIVPPDQFTYKSLWMVQEYGGWDLYRLLRNSKRISNWGEAHIRSIMYQLLCGLLYLQSGNIVHRDLKPSNILINSQCDIKIIDFGLARQMNHQYAEHRESRRHRGCGYPAPPQPAAPTHPARGHALVPRSGAHFDAGILQRRHRHVVRRLHFRGVIADAGAGDEGAAAVSRENVFPAQRGEKRAGKQREAGRGVSR